MKYITICFLIILSTTKLVAQITQNSVWTWVHGDSAYNKKGSYGVKGVAAPANNPGARRGSATWVDQSDNLWLYGGRGIATDTTGSLNDLWKYTKQTNSWTFVNGTDSANKYAVYNGIGTPGVSNNPGALSLRACWKDYSGNFWIMGSGTTLWKYDVPADSWILVKGDTATTAAARFGMYGTKGVAAASNRPGMRFVDMGWTDKQGNLWLFGGTGSGSSANGYLNDLWKYNIETNEWTWMKGDSAVGSRSIFGTKGVAAPNNTPGGRFQATTWTDTAGNFWLFGGIGRAVFTANNAIVDFYMNDLWKYDVSSNQWAWINGDTTTGYTQFSIYGTQGVASPSNKPGIRGDASGIADANGNLYLFHGWGSSATQNNVLQNDFWKYDIASNQWTWLKGDVTGNQQSNFGNKGIAVATNKPGNRWDTNTWIDTLGNIWMLGGQSFRDNNNAQVLLNDMWCLSNIYTTKASGNWNDPATWANNVVPPPNQKVIIYNQVVVNANATVASLEVKPGAEVQVLPGVLFTVLQ